MAPPAGQFRPGRYFAFFVVIAAALYSLVFFTGGGDPTPKLGIDLKGGTRVTLTARTPDGSDPSRDQLQQAREIIQNRVNGIGVSGAEVVLDGSNVVITVPGQEGEQAKTLGQTAKLGIRKVIAVQPAGAAPGQQQGQQQPGEGSGEQGGQGDPGTEPPAEEGAGGAPESGEPAPTSAGGGSAPEARQQDDGNGADTDEVAQRIQQAKQVRQNPELIPADPSDQREVQAAQRAQQRAMSQLSCAPGRIDPLTGNDDPNRPLVACGDDGAQKYVLGPVFLQGTQIETASAVYDSQQGNGWVVNLSFNDRGGRIWADFTSANVGERAAFVLDTEVVSAPSINQAIAGGDTQIYGDFGQAEAQNLADVLKYGSLPLSFDSSDATTVSATLGLATLEAGLIAGAVGLALVFVYCLFYYRILGVLTVLSLALSAMIIYAVLVLLGRWIGYTLDIAGVVGFIVAIGVTADSFVVYFERLKDEMREGRTFRSAVPRGWVKARRTILASDAVMFLAAVVLYVLAVGEVKGFAFTLGLSTVLDLIVVFLITHPLVALVAKSKKLSSPRLSGLGAVQRIGSSRRTANRLGTAVKEA
ncbi:protein translocase subunit SecD [Saccharomonospora halophila]|uniref:protein translocase subunit SecD n=1 Tax=Saccharomonospora halophila TaxID=129922 RepID=UPI00037AB3BD|nr:protein translocase subunit SecD [Saccharomonospora halophila]